MDIFVNTNGKVIARHAVIHDSVEFYDDENHRVASAALDRLRDVNADFTIRCYDGPKILTSPVLPLAPGCGDYLLFLIRVILYSLFASNEVGTYTLQRNQLVLPPPQNANPMAAAVLAARARMDEAVRQFNDAHRFTLREIDELCFSLIGLIDHAEIQRVGNYLSRYTRAERQPDLQQPLLQAAQGNAVVQVQGNPVPPQNRNNAFLPPHRILDYIDGLDEENQQLRDRAIKGRMLIAISSYHKSLNQEGQQSFRDDPYGADHLQGIARMAVVEAAKDLQIELSPQEVGRSAIQVLQGHDIGDPDVNNPVRYEQNLEKQDRKTNRLAAIGAATNDYLTRVNPPTPAS